MACPFISCCSDRNKSDSQLSPAQKEQLPVYFAAGAVTYHSRSESTIGVSFSTKFPYSKEVTEEVLGFYDKKMTQLGFRPFVEDYYKYADRNWSGPFIDSTEKNSPHVRQLNASWANDSKSKRADLILKYYWYVNNKQSTIVLGYNDDLKINFQLMPFLTLPPPISVQN